MALLENLLIRLFKKFEFYDPNGNRYYSSITDGYQKRFVVYKDIYDAANIAPKYHAWLHHLIDSLEEIDHKANIIYNNKSKKVDIIKQKAYYSSWSPKI